MMRVNRAVETATGHEFPVLARRLFGDVQLSFPDGREERSRLESAVFGACRLSRLEAAAHTVRGDHVTRGPENPDGIKVIFPLEGQGVMSQGGRSAAVAPGRGVIYDPARPYALANSTAVRLLMLQLPRTVLQPSVVARLRGPFAVSAENAGLQLILMSMMTSSLSEIDGMAPAARTGIGHTMIDLVRTMMTAGCGGADETPRSLDVLLRRIKDDIARHIEDPELNVSGIARRMGCSVRYVYRAFDAEQTTPMAYIWNLRIERAAARLRVVRHAPGVISEVAFSLGFSSSAHFARAFRRRYDLTPSEWQRMPAQCMEDSVTCQA